MASSTPKRAGELTEKQIEGPHRGPSGFQLDLYGSRPRPAYPLHEE